MSRQGYIKIMSALVNLIVIVMVEAGRVPLDSATSIGKNMLKAITGGTGEDNKK